MYIGVFVCLLLSAWLGFLSTCKQTFRSLKQSFQKSVKIFTTLKLYCSCVPVQETRSFWSHHLCAKPDYVTFFYKDNSGNKQCKWRT